MKKLFLLIGFAFLNSLAFSQTLSLEETISYINQKLKEDEASAKYSQFEQIEINREGEIIKNTYSYLGGVNNKLFFSTKVFALDLNNQTEIDNSNSALGGNISVNIKCNNSNCVTQKNLNTNAINSYNKITFYMTNNRNAEKLKNALIYLLSLTKERASEISKNDNDPFGSNNFSKPKEVILSDPSSKNVKLSSQNGVYYINVQIGNISKKFILDSGASDVLISTQLEQELIKKNILKKENYLSDGLYKIADGSIIKCRRMIIPELKIGTFILKNVRATVNFTDSMLLGKSVLDKFKSWKINNIKQELELEK